MIVVTSWIPVPDAPTTPIFPGATTFVKAMGILDKIPVPQSGPIISNPFSCANFFRRTSSSIAILSVNEKTCRLFFNARAISAAPYSPGILNKATLASGNCFNASFHVVTDLFGCAVSFADRSAKKSSIIGSTFSMIDSSSLSTTIIKSFADAVCAFSVKSDVLFKISLLASVPIMIWLMLTSSSELI